MRSRSIAIVAATLALAALVFAPAALAGGGCHPIGPTEPVPASGSRANVTMDGCVFLPAVDRVVVGTTVTFTNTSNAPHDVTGANYEWGSAQLAPGASFRHTFTEAGIHPYSCSLHPGMAAIVEVVADGDEADLAAAPDVAPPAATDGGDDALVPLAAGAFGLVIGAILAGVLARRIERGRTTAA